MALLRYLLFPLALIFVLITEIRNLLYKSGILKASKFDLPVISIGNLSVGGTGKSPMTDLLVYHLKSQYRVAVLSRGYGRSSGDYHEVLISDNSRISGDEPLQLKKNHPDIPVAVDANRVRGILQLLNNHEEIEVVLLDDAFQHRAVQPGFSILLTAYSDPFFTDFVLPTGNLRELRKNAKRADLIVVTKAPVHLSESEKSAFRSHIQKFSKAPVFFASITYTNIVPLFKNLPETTSEGKKIMSLTGIAKPATLENHLKIKASGFRSLRYSDHHKFTSRDLEKIRAEFLDFSGGTGMICTTEKDAVRLLSMSENDLQKISDLPVYYQKITTTIHQEEEFKKLIHEYLTANSGNHRVS